MTHMQHFAAIAPVCEQGIQVSFILLPNCNGSKINSFVVFSLGINMLVFSKVVSSLKQL